MDAVHYLKEIVEPTIADYLADPTSLRKALIACIVTYHSIEYFGAVQRRTEWRRKCTEFAIVDDIAHAAKHGSTSTKPGRGTSVDDVIARPPARCGVFRLGLSRPGDLTGGITTRKNVNMDLRRVLPATVNFLRSNL